MPHGPIEYLVFEFNGHQFRGEIVPALRDAVASGAINVLDLVFARKDQDGKVTILELDQLGDNAATWRSITTNAAGLLSDEDIELLVDDLENNTAATLVLIEHAWATKFRDALVRANGRLVADGLIPAQVVDEVLQQRAQAAA